MLGHAPLVALAVLFSAAGAVQPPVVTVPARPDATASAEYSRITGVRELPDGRVIVLDGTERHLKLVDFAATRVTTIGRQGSGPGEYLMPERLFPLGAGATGLRDGARRNLLVLSALAVPIGALNPQGPAPRIGQRVLRAPSPVATDTAGRFYAALTLLHQLPDGRLIARDSFALVRWSPGAARLDTMALLPQRLPPTAIVEDGLLVSPPGPVEPYRVAVRWAVAHDGTIGVVHPEPYRIELIGPEVGVWRRSAPVAYSPIRVTEAHKRQWRREQGMPVVQVAYPGGGTSPYVRTFRPGLREPMRWPRTLPAVAGDPPSFDLLGRLWVGRTTAAGAPPLLDVFDRRGRHVVQVRLPPATRLVGFGDGVIYLARRTADDLEYLQQHALPVGVR